MKTENTRKYVVNIREWEHLSGRIVASFEAKEDFTVEILEEKTALQDIGVRFTVPATTEKQVLKIKRKKNNSGWEVEN